jgi:hypothetical protein
MLCENIREEIVHVLWKNGVIMHPMQGPHMRYIHAYKLEQRDSAEWIARTPG